MNIVDGFIIMRLFVLSCDIFGLIALHNMIGYLKHSICKFVIYFDMENQFSMSAVVTFRVKTITVNLFVKGNLVSLLATLSA